MSTESEKHAAAMAVSRFGVDRARVKQVFKAVLQAQAQGRPADLLDTLVDKKLLTSDQAQELRQALQVTRLDAGVAGPAGPVNPRPFAAADHGANGSRDGADAPGSDPRSLGEFRILRRLGEGGMGSVYLGYHEGQGRHVAIKVLADHLASNQAYIERFYREARSVASLDHPNIVRSITAGQDPATGKQYLVLEYVDGPSAHSLLERFGRLAIGDALHIILDIGRALEHAHSRNIVHRDIKPDNILLTQSGVAKLSDLGLAKRTDQASHLTEARQSFGTPYYMPYEQAKNARSADGRSDIFALGATLYHLLTGEVPFAGNSPVEIAEKKEIGAYAPARSLNPAIPENLERILAKMMARQPDARYQTASELIVDLERSQLAAAVPSFVDPDLALRDPLVRARLTAPAPPTRPDLEAPTNDSAGASGNPNVWYLRYRNREGRWCKTRATTQQIVQGLRDGRLARTVEAGRQPHGEFRPLASYPEFGEHSVGSRPRSKGKRPGTAKTAQPSVAPSSVRTPPTGERRGSGLWFTLLGLTLLGAVTAAAYYLVY